MIGHIEAILVHKKCSIEDKKNIPKVTMGWIPHTIIYQFGWSIILQIDNKTTFLVKMALNVLNIKWHMRVHVFCHSMKFESEYFQSVISKYLWFDNVQKIFQIGSEFTRWKQGGNDLITKIFLGNSLLSDLTDYEKCATIMKNN